jgi:hypothetical protein
VRHCRSWYVWVIVHRRSRMLPQRVVIMVHTFVFGFGGRRMRLWCVARLCGGVLSARAETRRPRKRPSRD